MQKISLKNIFWRINHEEIEVTDLITDVTDLIDTVNRIEEKIKCGVEVRE